MQISSQTGFYDVGNLKSIFPAAWKNMFGKKVTLHTIYDSSVFRKKNGKNKRQMKGESTSFLRSSPTYAVCRHTHDLLTRGLRDVWICICVLDREK